MLEISISLAITACCGLSFDYELHNPITELDKRVDAIELVAPFENYVSKEDLSGMIDRVEGHLIRLENKLDKLTYLEIIVTLIN